MADFAKLRPGASMSSGYSGRWKITARFRLITGTGEPIQCIRVRHGVGPTMYFTTQRFYELFELVPSDA